jgi:hypothetical protein
MGGGWWVGRGGVKLMNQLIISRPKVAAHNYTELQYIKGTPTKFSPTTSSACRSCTVLLKGTVKQG